MINLGPFSGKSCPDVRFRPALSDRVLEGIALLCMLATWGCIYWLYAWKEEPFSPELWAIGGASVCCFVIMGVCSYLPVRFINFPVRVSERNIGIQYLLAIRLTRVMNVVLNFTFLSGVLMKYFKFAEILFIASFVLLGLAFVIYYILAYRYK